MSRRARRRRAKRIRNTVTVGVVLILLVMASLGLTAKTTSAGDANHHSYKYYTSISIKDGDTLWSIAEEHITKEYSTMNEYIKEVQTLNGLNGTNIRSGCTLVIPYYSEEYQQ